MIFVVGMILGWIGAISMIMWSWEWFGDIWHQNSLSRLWILPYIASIALNFMFIKFSPLFLKNFSIFWYHYLISFTLFILSSVICIYWATTK